MEEEKATCGCGSSIGSNQQAPLLSTQAHKVFFSLPTLFAFAASRLLVSPSLFFSVSYPLPLH
jgi:hypothetical protein